MLLEPDRDQLEIFINALFRHAGEGGYVSLRSFLPNNKVLKPIRAVMMNGNGALIDLADVAEDQARRAANEQQAAVFCPPIAVFNSREGWQAREEDLYKGLVLSVECDERPDEARWTLEEILGPATMVIRSGGVWIDPDEGEAQDKLHLHWRLAQPAMGDDLAKLKQARRLATAIVGADPSNIPAVHCLRWPGSWHRKGEPRLCEIVTVSADAEINLDTALAALQAAAPPVPQARSSEDRNSASTPQDWSELTGNIVAGKKLHGSIARLAARYIKSGMSGGAAVNQLRGLMDISAARQERAEEWKDRYEDIPRAVETAEQKYAAPPPEDPKPQPEPSKLDDVVAVFDKWIELENHEPIYVTLGAVAANYLAGPPVWLGLLAPPSSAKTEILNSLSRLDKAQLATTMSPAALLSGVPKKQVHKDAKGGLLRETGAFGLLVLKDFTSVLGLHKDDLSAMLDALREIYDGRWVRHLGTEGGRKLYWEGKLGLVFGCTEAYDSHYAVIGTLGDRFILYRLPRSKEDRVDQFEAALRHSGEQFKTMQDELAAAVAGLFAGLPQPLPTPKPLTTEESLRLKKVVILACCLRGAVVRDRYHREIEAVHGPEGPGRLALCLERLLAGLDVIGMDREAALQLVEKVTLDSVPPIRRQAYDALKDGPQKTREVATALGMPTGTTRRALEDITAQGLATRQRTKSVKGTRGKEGRDDTWTRVELDVRAAARHSFPQSGLMQTDADAQRSFPQKGLVQKPNSKPDSKPFIDTTKHAKPFCGNDSENEGESPAFVEVSAEKPRFRRVGSAQLGTVCAQCQSDAGNLFRIADGTILGGKAETLHFACAEAWFDAVKNVSPPH